MSAATTSSSSSAASSSLLSSNHTIDSQHRIHTHTHHPMLHFPFPPPPPPPPHHLHMLHNPPPHLLHNRIIHPSTDSDLHHRHSPSLTFDHQQFIVSPALGSQSPPAEGRGLAEEEQHKSTASDDHSSPGQTSTDLHSFRTSPVSPSLSFGSELTGLPVELQTPLMQSTQVLAQLHTRHSLHSSSRSPSFPPLSSLSSPPFLHTYTADEEHHRPTPIVLVTPPSPAVSPSTTSTLSSATSASVMSLPAPAIRPASTGRLTSSADRPTPNASSSSTRKQQNTSDDPSNDSSPTGGGSGSRSGTKKKRGRPPSNRSAQIKKEKVDHSYPDNSTSGNGEEAKSVSSENASLASLAELAGRARVSTPPSVKALAEHKWESSSLYTVKTEEYKYSAHTYTENNKPVVIQPASHSASIYHSASTSTSSSSSPRSSGLDSEDEPDDEAMLTGSEDEMFDEDEPGSVTPPSAAASIPLRKKRKNLSNRKTRLILCFECQSEHPNEVAMYAHIVEVHKKHLCPNCHRQFPDAAAVKAHLSVHSRDRQHVCNFCGEGFTQSGHCKEHERIHTGEKPFVCPVAGCERGFSRNSYLKQHARIHSGEKRFICDLCDKGFRQSSTLKSHKRIHTGEKPYSCPLCPKTFRHGNTRKAHLQSEHGQTVSAGAPHHITLTSLTATTKNNNNNQPATDNNTTGTNNTTTTTTATATTPPGTAQNNTHSNAVEPGHKVRKTVSKQRAEKQAAAAGNKHPTPTDANTTARDVDTDEHPGQSRESKDNNAAADDNAASHSSGDTLTPSLARLEHTTLPSEPAHLFDLPPVAHLPPHPHPLAHPHHHPPPLHGHLPAPHRMPPPYMIPEAAAELAELQKKHPELQHIGFPVPPHRLPFSHQPSLPLMLPPGHPPPGFHHRAPIPLPPLAAGNGAPYPFHLIPPLVPPPPPPPPLLRSMFVPILSSQTNMGKGEETLIKQEVGAKLQMHTQPHNNNAVTKIQLQDERVAS